MTPKERVAELIEAGAAIAVYFIRHPALTFTLAGALWLKDPLRLRWCAIFPEDQHHIHETSYDTAKLVVNGRDVAFLERDRIVAYVCPVAEGGLPLDEVQDALAEWRALLAVEGNSEQFAGFLEEA